MAISQKVRPIESEETPSAAVTSKSGNQESALVALVGTLILAALVQPAFLTYFFGDDFIYLGQYWKHDSHYWSAVFSPTDNVFFRPAFSAINLIWQFILPRDPFVHHLRNFLFTVLNIVLLHRLTLRLIPTRVARVVAILFFVVSKVHFTTIGYINCYDSIVHLALILTTLLCFVRFIQLRQRRDYLLGLAFCFIALFTRDYGLVITGLIVACTVALVSWEGETAAKVRFWAIRLAPLPLFVMIYLAIRFTIVGPIPMNPASPYAPKFSSEETALKSATLFSTAANISLVNNGATGAPGLPQVLSGNAKNVASIAAVFTAAFLILLLVTFFAGRRQGLHLLLPLVWIAAYFGPTLLTRNMQMYYMYEPIAGLALLIGMLLVFAPRKLVIAWGIALVVIAVNGAISNYSSTYHWQFVAQAMGKVQRTAIEPFRGRSDIRVMNFVTSNIPFWSYAIIGDGKGPVIPAVLGRPDLIVRVISPESAPMTREEIKPGEVYFTTDNEVALYDPATRPKPPRLLGLSPGNVAAGRGFNVQQNGVSALVVTTENAVSSSVVVFNGQKLTTAYGGPTWMSALVPPQLLATPGKFDVYVTTGSVRSNVVPFEVADASSTQTPAPVWYREGPLKIVTVLPGSLPAGKAVNAQPGGDSAISITCENATPTTTVYFDGKALTTSFGGAKWVTAALPPALYRRPGKYEIELRDGRETSPPVQVPVQ